MTEPVRLNAIARGQRAEQYAELKEQLDTLWHDIHDGRFGDAAKLGNFYINNKTVKDNNPLQDED